MKGKKNIKIFAFFMKTLSNSEGCSKSIKISIPASVLDLGQEGFSPVFTP
jgi:hypothetical protein